MRKFKTVFSSVILALACVLFSACSCSGDTAPAQVYPSTIEISLASASETVTSTYDSTSGVLNIDCHVGDTFGIKYSLNPTNTTATQVDWEFSKKDLVYPTQHDFSRSRSVEEVVEFKARNRSETAYETQLVFRTQPSGDSAKKATCNIRVYPAVANLPVFLTPSNVTFNSATSTLSWDKVTRVNLNGTEQNATMQGGAPVGLERYDVTIVNQLNGTSETYQVAKNKNTFSFTENNIPDGVTYSIRVKAIADNNNAVSSASSEEFKMYRLLAPSDVAYNNGTITFTTPKMSAENRVFYYGVSNDTKVKSRSTSPDTQVSFDGGNEFDTENGNTYSVQIVSYPQGFNADRGYATQNGTRMYPSVPTSVYTIERLGAPAVTLSDRRASASIGGVQFTGSGDNCPHASTAISWSVDKVYDDQFAHKYKWTIFEIIGDGESPRKSSEGDGETDTSVALDGLTAGRYKIVVQSVGNTANTIASTESTMEFNILPQLQEADVTLSNDMLKIDDDKFGSAGGVELFFVKVDGDRKVASDSKRVELATAGDVNGYDISRLGLTAGKYELYVRLVCRIEDGYMNGMCVQQNYTKMLSLTVANTVSGKVDDNNCPLITADGTIKFNKANGFDVYAVTVWTKLKSAGANEYTELSPVKIYPTDNGAEGEVVKYTNSNGVISVNIRDILNEILKSYTAGSERVTAETMLASTNTLKFSIVTCGNDEGPETVISSSPTEQVEFESVRPVSTGVTLVKYHISFPAETYGTSQKFALTLKTNNKNGNDKKDYTFTPEVSRTADGRIDIDLSALKYTENEVEKSFESLINTDGTNTIVITALGYTGFAGSKAMLNSSQSSTGFGIAGTVSGLKLDDSGVLSWTSSTTGDNIQQNNHTYTIKFYKISGVEGGSTSTLITDETITGVVPTLEPGDMESEDMTYTVTLREDIGDVLDRYKDQVIGITVTENQEGMFNGKESAIYYATRVSNPTLKKSADGGRYSITWEPISNASVYNVSYNADNGTSGAVSGTGDTSFNISGMITANVDPWQAGVYTITVVAKGSNVEGENSALSPFVLSSVESTITIYLIDSAIDVTADGTMLSWNDLLEGTGFEAQYTLDYLLPGEQNTADKHHVVELQTNRSYDTANAEPKFTAGTNKVTITPKVDFVSVGGDSIGIVLIGITKENQITKWEQAKNLKAQNGNLVFDVYGATDQSSVTIELYQGDTGAETLVSPSSYNIISATPVTGAEPDEGGQHLQYVISLDGLNAGELKLSVIVKSTNTLASNRSDYCTGTKLAQVSDFLKKGVWLTWSPEEGVTGYEISYKNGAEETVNVLKLSVKKQGSGDGYECLVLNNDEEETTSTNEDIFKYENGKFMLKFDHDRFVGTATGDIALAIRAITESNNYFNGNMSANYTVTKLNATVEMTIVDGKLNISNYVADGSQTPMQYEITIYAMETVQQDADDGSKVDVLQRKKKDGEEIKWTDTQAYTQRGEGLNIDPIDLNDIGLSDAGAYNVVLRFLGDGDEPTTANDIVLNSAYVLVADGSGQTFNKLGVSALSTADGKVVWQNEDNSASSFTLKVTDGTQVYIFENISAGSGQVTLDESTLMVYTPDPEPEPDVDSGDGGDEEDDDEDHGLMPTALTPFLFEPGKVYTLQIMANASDKLHSAWSAGFKVKKLYAPTDLKIVSNYQKDVEVLVETPGEDGSEFTETTKETVELGAPIISWQTQNALSGAQHLSYELQYLGTQGGQNSVVKINSSENNLYPLDTHLNIGTYELKLKTIGNSTTGTDMIGLLSSDYQAQRLDATYGNETTSVSISAGVIRWAPVAGAYAYRVVVYDQKATEGKTYSDYVTSGGADKVSQEHIKYETYVAGESIDFSKLNISEDAYFTGAYTFAVFALTVPNVNIISVSPSAISGYTNSANMYRPEILNNYRVKDGMLSYQISVKSIKAFVESTMVDGTTQLALTDPSGDVTAVTKALITYAVGRVNGSVEPIAELDEQITFLLSVTLSINGSVITDSPYTAGVYKNDAETQTEILEAEYGADDEQYIEYSYNVAIEPDLTGGNTDDGEGEGDLGDENEDMQSGISRIASTASEQGVEYKAGRYDIKISAVGNSSSTTPVVSGGYTTVLTAFKPNTPITWSTGGGDIDHGEVQWGLSTTPNSTLEKFEYYEDYKIEAVTIGNGESINTLKYTTVSIKDTKQEDGSNPNLKDGYKYSRNFKDDLFTTKIAKENPEKQTNQVLENTNYRLLISTIGTKDSTKLGDGELIYLNSNKCVVGSIANILSTSRTPSVKQSNLTWQTANGSLATRLYIYGPFDDKATITGDGNDPLTKVTKKDGWENELIKFDTNEEDGTKTYTELDKVLKANTTTLSKEEEQELGKYKDKLHIVNLDDSTGSRPLQYTLTDALEKYEAGGYIIRLQEIGDEKGIIDSEIGEPLVVNKLATPKMQTSGWVGTNQSGIYVWNRGEQSAKGVDNWKAKMYGTQPPQADERIGNFVWEPVPLANAYRVELFKQAGDGSDGSTTKISEAIVRETVYELVSGDAFNEDGYKYFVRLTALRTDLDSDNLADNYFNSDLIDTTSHLRLPMPSDLMVYGTGKITWNSGIDYDNIKQFRVRYNFGGEQNTSSVEVRSVVSGHETTIPQTPLEYTMGEHGQDGTISIAVKSLALENTTDNGTAYLNSSYCSPRIVTRLADPNVRVEDGVFNWGTAGDPLTDSKLTIFRGATASGDGQNVTVTQDSKETFYKYFTEINEHNPDYKASNDATAFPAGEKTFTVYFEGSGGDTGEPMQDGDVNYLIASNVKTLTATKLNTPTATNARIDVSGNITNRVEFNEIANALGYRVKIFITVSGQTQDPVTIDVSADTLRELGEQSTSEGQNADYFSVETIDGGKKIYVILDGFLESTDLKTNGGSMYVYVQALGSGVEAFGKDDGKPAEGSTLYISSSYSDYTTIAVPPMPSDLQYESTTGTVSWKVNSPDQFSIKLVTSYKVTGVTEAELNNYWKKTSDVHRANAGGDATTNENIEGRYKEIVRREIVYTSDRGDVSSNTYSIEVTDTIRLSARENDNKTPTSYQLTVIGENYQFFITAIAFESEDDGADDEFASPTLQSENNNTFNVFGKGDGSDGYPYTVATYPQLNSIRYFLTRSFELTESITINSVENGKWNTIQGEFTGTIDGKGKTISNLDLTGDGATSDTLGSVRAFVETNKGTIKNITFTVSTSINSVLGGISVATVAVNNRGTIENVTVTGTISVINTRTSNENNSTQVGGIAVNNYGTIKGAKVTMTLVAKDGGNSSQAGGIATNNFADGNIINCYVLKGESGSGTSITANQVGGIASLNNGTIDHCSVEGDIHVTDYAYNNTYTNQGIAGGIVARLMKSGTSDKPAVIKNSFSTATIYIERGASTNNKQMSVGGLVGYIVDNSGITISNTFVIVKMKVEDSSSVNTSANFMLYGMMPSASDATLTNNYYYVEEVVSQLGDHVDVNVSGKVEKCNDLTALKTKIKDLKDSSNNQLYDTNDSEEQGYPKFKQNNG